MKKITSGKTVKNGGDDKKNELIKLLKNFDTNTARKFEEEIDVQYQMLTNLHNSLIEQVEDEIKDFYKDLAIEVFVKLVVMNSLISYQLSSTGEAWWTEFSKYWSNKENKILEKYSGNKELLLDEFVNFLKNSKGNRRFHITKIKRLEKIYEFLKDLTFEEIKYYYENMDELRNIISKNLDTQKSAKTVVFSVKMYGYACRISFNQYIAYPMNIEIPLDSRIEKYTKKILDMDLKSPKKIQGIKLTDKYMLEFWKDVSESAEIPPLHIDSIIWTALGTAFDKKKLNEEEQTNIEKLILFNQ
ncbi:N-glycosylase/DNA lyase [Methanococcus voltae]|uniref:N-glycosylase/DNA lyase n=2 Tax=Methanococcus voltae TaxID=2188 RepID=A0A8J7USM9_METVO|nr:N-glycosylase/DNA lyase [Methanococcus voltae]MBP2172306.1 DNA-(apurinic or apyrimidinic site) lyase [Methanococcus voltae]MBP2200738.1 DNA-(apurinic or apyrimidinic site) lyase [Methanococcus voltae]MCS3921462.1 DNA-(apurinic or apyrimidinic site) lyase [Methanococcus voltae PS]